MNTNSISQRVKLVTLGPLLSTAIFLESAVIQCSQFSEPPYEMSNAVGLLGDKFLNICTKFVKLFL